MTLDEFLTARKLTERAFAGKTGLSQSHVHRLRRRQVDPSLRVMKRIREESGGAIDFVDWDRVAGVAE